MHEAVVATKDRAARLQGQVDAFNETMLGLLERVEYRLVTGGEDLEATSTACDTRPSSAAGCRAELEAACCTTVGTTRRIPIASAFISMAKWSAPFG